MFIPDYPEVPPMSEQEYVLFHRKRRAMIHQMLNKHLPESVHSVLDIGGGANVLGVGAFLRERWKAEVHCLDLGEDANRYQQEGLYFHTVNVDLEVLPFENACFDAVLFTSIIEHLYNPAFALAECARVLKNGGILLLEAPNAVSLGRRIDALKGRNPFRFFNASNTRPEKPPMFYCSIFYTLEEIQTLIAPFFETLEWQYGQHCPSISYWKQGIRKTILAINPRMSDCFAIAARRRSASP